MLALFPPSGAQPPPPHQLSMHHCGHENLIEQPRKQVDRVDQHQIVQRSGIRDGGPQKTSKPDAIEVLQISLHVSQGHGLEYAMRLEKAVDLVEHLEPKGTA